MALYALRSSTPKNPSTIRIELPQPHSGQIQVLDNLRRFNILCCGRRWGKDIILERRLVKQALHLRQPVGFFAPTYRMLLENWRTVRNLLAPVTLRANDSEHRLDLVTGNPVDMWSLDNIDAARGRKYGWVGINEAAMVRNLIDAWNMVIRPTLADYKGGADFGSTPKGLNGFYDLWTAAEHNPEWARFHFRTDDNPFIPPEEVIAMRQMPARVVRQEIDAEFVEDGAYFQGVDAVAVVGQPDKPEDHAGHHFLAAVDWGLSNDYTIIVIGCRECRKAVDWDRFTSMQFTYQRERLYSICQRWQVEGILPERNSFGEPNIEIVRGTIRVIGGPDHRPGFETTATTKPPLIQGLAMAIEQGGFLVPKVAAEELRVYEVDTLASGHQKFGAPEGRHDDWVMSLALLWWAMTKSIAPSDMIAFAG